MRVTDKTPASAKTYIFEQIVIQPLICMQNFKTLCFTPQ